MPIKLVDMKSNYVGTPEKWKQFIQLWSTKRIELNLDGNNFRYTLQSTDQIEILKKLKTLSQT